MSLSVAMLCVHTFPLDIPGRTKDAGGMNVYIRELARELGMQGEEGRTLRVLGDVAQAQGDLDVAEAYLTQSIAILRASAEEFEEARSQLALAQLLIAQGNHGEHTRAALERCGAIFERRDAALDLATAAGLLA